MANFLFELSMMCNYVIQHNSKPHAISRILATGKLQSTSAPTFQMQGFKIKFKNSISFPPQVEQLDVIDYFRSKLDLTTCV